MYLLIQNVTNVLRDGLQNARLPLLPHHSQRSGQLLQGCVNIKGLIVWVDVLLLNEDHFIYRRQSPDESGAKVFGGPLPIVLGPRLVAKTIAAVSNQWRIFHGGDQYSAIAI